MVGLQDWLPVLARQFGVKLPRYDRDFPWVDSLNFLIGNEEAAKLRNYSLEESEGINWKSFGWEAS